MSVIDDYLSHIQPAERAELQRLRQLVRQVVPGADEVISYGMPGFKYKGKYLLGFNAFKDHLSLFPTSTPVEAFHDQLQAYKASKGTIQFTLSNPLPDQLVKDIARFRKTMLDSD